MLLRSGKIYKLRDLTYIKKNKENPKFCGICSQDYKQGDYITSCDKSNIKKHSFHIHCFLEIKKYDKYFSTCPYCLQFLKRPLTKFKINYI